MTGVDTNILVRFLVGDDSKQANKIYDIFKNAEDQKQELFVPILVIIELIWMLESIDEIDRFDLLNVLSQLILMPIFSFEHLSAIQQFIPDVQTSNFDLSDLLIAHSAGSCGYHSILTFDKKASKHKFFELVTWQLPKHHCHSSISRGHHKTITGMGRNYPCPGFPQFS